MSSGLVSRSHGAASCPRGARARLRVPVLALALGIGWAAQSGFAAAAEAPPSPPPTATEARDLRASEERVEVRQAPADEAISRRLLAILAATERFESPQVEVVHGVVFLSGSTPRPEDREWAEDLASRTEGVVAVSNDIAVADPVGWSLAPALGEVRRLQVAATRAAPAVALGLLVLGLVGLMAGAATRLAGRLLLPRMRSELVRAILEKLILIGIILVGVYLFLQISGLTRLAVTVLGGTGLLGLVVGFAFRDIAENFLASVLLSVQRPFGIGDTIEVAGHKGVVQKVTARGTVLMDFDGNHVQLLNSTVYKSTIKNLTANPASRHTFTVGIGYDSSLSGAQNVVLGVMTGHDAVLAEPAPQVLVEELGAATVVLRAYFWVDGHRHGPPQVRSAVMRRCLRSLCEAGITLPDEARELVFPYPVPVRMLGAPSPEDGSPRPRAGGGGERSAPTGPAADPPTGDPADHAEATPAEGGLDSEVADLERQAARSRSPEAGADLLGGEGRAIPR